MAKPRSRVHHGAKGQVRRDALLHSRSRWLHYRSWAKQAGLRLRLSGTTTRESICGDHKVSVVIANRAVLVGAKIGQRPDPRSVAKNRDALAARDRNDPRSLVRYGLRRAHKAPAVAAHSSALVDPPLAPGRQRMKHADRRRPRMAGSDVSISCLLLSEWLIR